ncbi:MAG: DUF1730 domain-containing protein [Pirellulales bacterium]|nr:DUF1730 domain-containing protein [Pirellulales bacterium]
MDAPSLTAALKRKALELGFDLAEAAPVSHGGVDIDNFEQWLAQGRAGEMRYFADRLDAYRDPNRVLEGVISVLMLGMNYRTVEPIEPQAGQGKVSRYAWGDDYHDVIHGRLRRLAEFFRQLVPAGKARGIVDTAPFLERYHAARAGLGWIGKNTLLVNRRFGTWIFLAALLTTEELDYSASIRRESIHAVSPEGTVVISQGRKPLGEAKNNNISPERAAVIELLPPLRGSPITTVCIQGLTPLANDCRPVGTITPTETSLPIPENPCHNCRACLDACPTGALVAPYQLDARRCVSYLTIEHRGEFPEELKSKIGSRLFGCDACQEACPWNRRTPATAEKAFDPREGMNPVDIAKLQSLDEETFRRRFRGTPFWRIKLDGMLRNAAIVKENEDRSLRNDRSKDDRKM